MSVAGLRVRPPCGMQARHGTCVLNNAKPQATTFPGTSRKPTPNDVHSSTSTETSPMNEGSPIDTAKQEASQVLRVITIKHKKDAQSPKNLELAWNNRCCISLPGLVFLRMKYCRGVNAITSLLEEKNGYDYPRTPLSMYVTYPSRRNHTTERALPSFLQRVWAFSIYIEI